MVAIDINIYIRNCLQITDIPKFILGVKILRKYDISVVSNYN